MSSLIFIFFCLTKSSGSPSSVTPGAGTLIRYSFAIGLNTCWMRNRSACSMASVAAPAPVGMVVMRPMLPGRRGAAYPQFGAVGDRWASRARRWPWCW